MAINGTTGADRLNGVVGKDTEINGGEGNDTLAGNTGNDTLVGGVGNDSLAGGAGADTYIYRAGDGSDRIDAGAGAGSAGAVDKLVMDGINASEVKFSHKGADLFIDHAGARITIANWYATTATAASNRLASIEFADKSFTTAEITKLGLAMYGTDGADSLQATAGWDNVIEGGLGNDNISGNAGADTLSGDAGNDILNGNAGADILRGGAGNDTLTGGAGADTYIYQVAGGNDRIDAGTGAGKEGAVDKLVMEGINFADVRISHGGSDLYIDHADGRITVANWYTTGATAVNNRLATIEFADKTLTTEEVSKLGQAMFGTSGADRLTALNDDDTMVDGGLGSDTIISLGGNDKLYGGAGNDGIDGGAGNDYIDGGADVDNIKGGAGDDTIIGGTGNDILSGGAGADTYIYRAGDGNDRIDAGLMSGGGASVDKLVMDGINLADVKISRGNSDLFIDHAGARITIVNWYATTPGGPASRLASIEFADESLATDAINKLGLTVVGTDAVDRVAALGGWDNVISGGNGNDALTGNTGNDTLSGDAGNDVISGGAGNDVLSGGDGNDNVKGEIGDDVITGGAGMDTLSGGDGADALDGGDDADTINGDAGMDTIIGGKGNDILAGGDGADTYIYRAGDGSDKISVGQGVVAPGSVDVLVMEGINSADVKVGRVNSDLILEHAGERITLVNWYNTAKTGDNFRLKSVEFADKVIDSAELSKMGLTVVGTDAVDKPMALAGWNNDISGGGGNDSITGSTGNDTLSGDAGNDIITAGAGDDTVSGGEGNDKLSGDAGNDAIDGGAGDDIITGGLGNDVILGGEGNDNLKGEVGDDVITGGAGNDIIAGGAGTDTYIFSSGDGKDRIDAGMEAGNIKTAVDHLVFKDVAFEDAKFSHSGADLFIDYGSDRVTVANWFNSANTDAPRLADITFSDGKVLNTAQITSYGLAMNGTDAADNLVGTNNYENLIYGGAGNDNIRGGNLDDHIFGGLGNDILNGGLGDDTYNISLGEGVDRITDAGGYDTLDFGTIALGDARFVKAGNALDIYVGDEQLVRIDVQLVGTGPAIEQFNFGGQSHGWGEIKGLMV